MRCTVCRPSRSLVTPKARVPIQLRPAVSPRRARVPPIVAFREDEQRRSQDAKPSDASAKPNVDLPFSKTPLIPAAATARAGTWLHPAARPYAAAGLAMTAGAFAVGFYPHQMMDLIFRAGTALGTTATTSLETQVARLMGMGLAMAAATNIAESRAGGHAGGTSEPKLEADTTTRLDRSLGAFGFLNILIVALAFTPLASRLLPGYVSGSSLLPPAAVGAITVLGALQWWVAGLQSPFDIIKGLVREFLSTPSRANNFNAATYALLGATFVTAGMSYLIAPGQTLSAVFGGGFAAEAGPRVWLMWQIAGAGLSCITAGACYALKEAASFKDLTETKFKWLNFGLAAGAVGHVIMLGPLAMGQGGPLAPVLLAVWALTMLMGCVNAFA